MTHSQEEELESVDGDDSGTDDELDRDAAQTGVYSGDKENMSPNISAPGVSTESSPISGKKPGTSAHERPRGRKRKRQEETSRSIRDAAARRRQRIRQYYNGATHCSASAVQVFAMAMQVNCFRLFCGVTHLELFVHGWHLVLGGCDTSVKILSDNHRPHPHFSLHSNLEA